MIVTSHLFRPSLRADDLPWPPFGPHRSSSLRVNSPQIDRVPMYMTAGFAFEFRELLGFIRFPPFHSELIG